MTRRYGHSISNYTVSDECVWIVITGGFKQFNPGYIIGTRITGPDTTVIVELGMLTLLNNYMYSTLKQLENVI